MKAIRARCPKVVWRSLRKSVLSMTNCANENRFGTIIHCPTIPTRPNLSARPSRLSVWGDWYSWVGSNHRPPDPQFEASHPSSSDQSRPVRKCWVWVKRVPPRPVLSQRVLTGPVAIRWQKPPHKPLGGEQALLDQPVGPPGATALAEPPAATEPHRHRTAILKGAKSQ
jgi:hypothetical protein